MTDHTAGQREPSAPSRGSVANHDAAPAAIAEDLGAGVTLTAAEREAIHWVLGDVADITGPVEDTLRGLLERMK